MDNEDVDGVYTSDAEELYENNAHEVEAAHDRNFAKNVLSLGMTFETSYGRIVGFSVRFLIVLKLSLGNL